MTLPTGAAKAPVPYGSSATGSSSRSSPSLASAGLSIRLFIVPCDEKTQYTTHNTSAIVSVTSYENRSVLENAAAALKSRRRRRRVDSIGTACGRRGDGVPRRPDAGYGLRDGH